MSYVRGPNTTAMDTYVNKNNTVDSNLIRNVGTMNFGGAGVWVFQSGENSIVRNAINRGPRNAVGLFGPDYICLSVANYTRHRTPEATAANLALGGSDVGLYDIPVWGFDAMFPVCHARNNTIAYNDMSNLVRDSCDPGLLESYGIPTPLSPLFLGRFSPVFRRFSAVLLCCLASWRQDGENGRKTAENGRNLGEKRARNSGG